MNLDAELSAIRVEIENTQRWIEREPTEIAVDNFLTPLNQQMAELREHRQHLANSLCNAQAAAAR